MLTMKQARKLAPSTPTARKAVPARLVLHMVAGKVIFDGPLPVRHSLYTIQKPKTLTTSFRQWARSEFSNRKDLSLKLAEVVNGK